MTSTSSVQADTWSERLKLDQGSGALVGGRCTQCANLMWPLPRACMRCGSLLLDREDLPESGVIETWTRVWIPVADIKPPYFIGRVRLGECCVFGRIQQKADEAIDVGINVRLCSSPHQEDQSELQYWFEVGVDNESLA